MQPDNDNTDPFTAPDTALAELYRLRQEVLKQDVGTLSFLRRRRRQDALKKFASAEAKLLAVLALPPQ
jgi:hypothetical protein